MDASENYYPDANSTIRLSYGKVMDYDPRDAVHYNFYTTLSGVMQKEDPSNEEFIVPAIDFRGFNRHGTVEIDRKLRQSPAFESAGQ